MTLVLLYHDVVEDDDDASGFSGGGPARYKLARPEFVRHLEAIAATGVSPHPSLDALTQAVRSGADRSPFFTFDDGGVSAATIIADELENRGWRGHFFITVDYIGQPGFVSRQQIQDLARRGHGIGSHSCSHPDPMSACSNEVLLEEWHRSCQTLAEILGQPIPSASVPGGSYSSAVARAAAQAGIKQLFNSEPTTRVGHESGCDILGRYTIYRGASADTAASLARGRSLTLLRQSVAWNMKKIAKVVGGKAYLKLRRRLLNRRYSQS